MINKIKKNLDSLITSALIGTTIFITMSYSEKDPLNVYKNNNQEQYVETTIQPNTSPSNIPYHEPYSLPEKIIGGLVGMIIGYGITKLVSEPNKKTGRLKYSSGGSLYREINNK